jgi:hypothetical protein
MKSSTRKRIKLGDIVEIETPEGFAYAQYINKNAMYGELIRVLPGIYAKRPDDLAALTMKRERFVTFFPVGPAVTRGHVAIAGAGIIPEHAIPFPLFKAGKPGNWWLWDGEREWRVGDLPPDQVRLPSREIWNVAMLVSRIVEGWAPEDEATKVN